MASPLTAAARAPATETSTGLLETVDLSKNFAGVRALRGVSLRLREGEIVGLIGPNGSGKTTFLNCVAGVLPPSGGEVLFDGRPIGGRPSHEIARAGIVRTFQNIRLFERLTCVRNVEVSALAAGRVKRRLSRERAQEVLGELGIGHFADRYAGTLSYGDQRRLEVARALAGNPRLLLLDEPAAGMNEAESDQLRASIERIRARRGCGVLVVEHDLRLIMQLCEMIYVLNEGQVISRGTPDEVRADPAVIAAYIGEEDRPTTGKERE